MRLATRIWFTVPPPIPRERLPALPPGTSAPVEVHGRALHVVTWGTGEPVYLVHGWGGRSEQLGGFVAPLVAAGYRVIAFDGPGHGGSPGPRSTMIPELAEALRAVVAEHGPPHAVIAHSMGAAVAAHAVRDGMRPRVLVLLAPAADPRWVLDRFVRRLGGGARVRGGLERAIVRRLGLPWEAFHVPSLHRSTPVPPTLVVHDVQDREVGPEHGRAIADAWPGVRLLQTEGLGHRRLLRDPSVIDRAVRFVTDARTIRRPA
ncbi:alpha/beta fold hydrolase [Pseudonocardia adelaidensis]|uniref:alpha/beta fold hydrolase n=1 Tax=Pseudonocardia adelaidensis TaxID=648754 RepID=UPI0031F178F6